jgi:hypothetical protein
MTPEEKDLNRNAATRLFQCDDLAATKDMLHILAECLFKMFNEHFKEKANDRMEYDCKIVCQMMFTKVLNLRKMLDGTDFTSRDGSALNNIIDPTIVAILVRNIYETIAAFNLIYVAHKNTEEKQILYNLWVVAGLKYRQSFAGSARSDENIKKMEGEAQDIQHLIREIEETTLYKSLDQKAQTIIQEKIKRKDYRIFFNGLDVQQLSWQDIVPVMEIKDEIMDKMYTYFSLYSHPSNVSVFQFKDLFGDPSDFLNMTNFNVKNAIMLISLYIGDYIKLFPNTQKYFDSLPPIDQWAINFHHRMARKDTGEINSALSMLN